MDRVIYENIRDEKSGINKTTHYAYDAAGKLTSRTDDDGNVHAYAYDTCGRLLSKTDEEGASEGDKKPNNHHLMHGQVIDEYGNVVFKDDYVSGGGTGGYQDGLLHHTERKFLGDVDVKIAEGVVSPGDHLYMQGDLVPCRPGCQPVISVC